MTSPPYSPQSIEQVDTDSLIPYARNARVHDDEQIARIAKSIGEYGFTNPVLIDGHGTIIAGHGRVLAAQQLGLAQVPCIRLTHLTDAQRRAYVIADNRLAELSSWDSAMLAGELEDLGADGMDFDLLGFDGDELENLLGTPAAAEKPTADDYADVGAGAAAAESKSAAILYPVIVQLSKADFARFNKFRGRRKPEEALVELLDMDASMHTEWQLVKASADLPDDPEAEQ